MSLSIDNFFKKLEEDSWRVEAFDSFISSYKYKESSVEKDLSLFENKLVDKLKSYALFSDDDRLNLSEVFLSLLLQSSILNLVLDNFKKNKQEFLQSEFDAFVKVKAELDSSISLLLSILRNAHCREKKDTSLDGFELGMGLEGAIESLKTCKNALILNLSSFLCLIRNRVETAKFTKLIAK